MIPNKILFSALFLLIGVISIAFQVKQNESLFVKPTNFPEPIYDFTQNPLTTEGVALGKALFYDALLSKDNTVSCGSCHQQSSGFTQHGHNLSHGVRDLLTKRNSMPLANMAWSSAFGWDGGVHDLDLFPLSPLQNPVEMDESLPNVLEKLKKTETYPPLFEKAFGTKDINSERFLKALSQFVLTMVSANSRYDKYIRNEGQTLSDIELEGEAIFKKKCTSCHSGVLFTDAKFRNNGLKANKNDDMGRYEVTRKENDRYAFKVPSLRNLASTAPYMHDGRFSSLEEVLEHYNSGVEDSPTLDPILKKNKTISLSKEDKTKIIAFLNTLNDTEFLKNKKFAEFDVDNFDPEKYRNIDWDRIDLKTDKPGVIATFYRVFDLYEAAKIALTTKNPVAISEATYKMLGEFNSMDFLTLTPLQRAFFQQIYEDLAFEVENITLTDDYRLQRNYFGNVSKYLMRMIQAFKTNEKPIYYFQCPTPFDKLGNYAVWLSATENDKNPFFPEGTDCKPIQMTLMPVK